MMKTELIFFCVKMQEEWNGALLWSEKSDWLGGIGRVAVADSNVKFEHHVEAMSSEAKMTSVKNNFSVTGFQRNGQQLMKTGSGWKKWRHLSRIQGKCWAGDWHWKFGLWFILSPQSKNDQIQLFEDISNGSPASHHSIPRVRVQNLVSHVAPQLTRTNLHVACEPPNPLSMCEHTALIVNIKNRCCYMSLAPWQAGQKPHDCAMLASSKMLPGRTLCTLQNGQKSEKNRFLPCSNIAGKTSRRIFSYIFGFDPTFFAEVTTNCLPNGHVFWIKSEANIKFGGFGTKLYKHGFAASPP